MALIIPNIGRSVLLDPSSNNALAFFTKMDSISMDVDGTLTPIYGGPGFYPVVNIGSDRKPQISIKGSETPLQAAGVLGATTTVAATGTPVQVAKIDEFTIGADGTVNLPSGDTISATVTNINVVGALDNKTFTAAATPTTGEYKTPVAGDTKVTFATADAGTKVVIQYTVDTTTGGSVDYYSTAVSKVVKLVASAQVINSEAPGQPLVPITFVVNACQFMGKWTVSQERGKASAAQLDLNILEPGGGLPAVQIITAAEFAG